VPDHQGLADLTQSRGDTKIKTFLDLRLHDAAALQESVELLHLDLISRATGRKDTLLGADLKQKRLSKERARVRE
jgi:hypothetical protein